MIREVYVDTWRDFEKILRQKFDEQQQTLAEMMGPPYIFRGQSDANWSLMTSLERSLGANIPLENYYSMILEIQTELETFTDKTWKIPNIQEYNSWLANHPISSLMPAYDYMIYLRQHGFPSPLLDWSFSPYIATYFAFHDIGNKAKSVAIFMYYTEFDSGSGITGKPYITRLDRAVRTHRRHYLQQSAYTICCGLDDKNRAYYASHQDLYSQDDDVGPYVTKYILPAKEREKALWSLEPYNINAYSLFGTEEGLLETLFLRNFVLENARKDVYGDSYY